MPLDPYFTSATPSGDDEFKKRKAFAKAFQLRRASANWKNRSKRREKAISRMGMSNTASAARARILLEKKAGHPVFVTGGPSLTGFKPPRKVWDART